MSFIDCMITALKEGKVSKERLEELKDALKDNGIDFDKPETSETPQAQKAIEKIVQDNEEKSALMKKQLVLAAEAKERNEARILAGASKPTIIENPIMSTFIDSLQNIENRKSVIQQQWGASLDKFFQKYAKGNFLGNFLRNEPDRDKFGREMMVEGSSKSSEHAALARDVQGVMDESVKRRTDAGEDIKPLKHYGLPTSHDGVAMGHAGFQAWKDSAMQNFVTIGGKTLGSVKDLPKVLREMYDDARSQHAGLQASDSLSQHRVIGFGNDYDKWKAYNKDFGMSAGDPINAVQSHLSHAAQSAAMMEEFGPKPTAMVRYLRDFSFNAASKMADDTSQIKRDLKKFDGIWKSYNDVDSPLSKAGAFYQGFRSAIYMRIAEIAYLSQATVDMFSRVPTLKMINNLPVSSVTNMFGSYLKTLVSDDARQLALRAGVAGDNIFSELHKGNDAIIRDHPIMGRVMSVNDPMARAFFVHAHMESLPRIMALDFLGNFARWKDMKFNDLPIRDSMERSGITQNDWDIFRKTEVIEHNGVNMLQPVDMLKRTDMDPKQLREIATKIGMYVNGESRETVPAPNLRNRYALIGSPDPNTVAGMISRDMTIALQFTMSTASMLTRGFMLKQGLASKIGFAGASAIALLTANALRLQAKAVASGRDFYTMDPTTKEGREFWEKNISSSGFTGPSLDLMNPEHGSGVLKETGKAGIDAYNGAKYELGLTNKNPHAGAALFKEGRHFIPGMDGWWAQLLMQHGALDAVQREIDPEAQEQWNRTAQFYQHTYGQQFFWPHGQLSPNRAPQ